MCPFIKYKYNNMNNLDMDLNIENYNLDDLLNLFNISINLTKEELKYAKKKVLYSHPDKSNLDPKFFFFFSNAYKILYQIFNFKHKHLTNNNNTLYTTHKTDKETYIDHKLLQKFFKNANFNIEFNKIFEENKLLDNYNETGYGDWLKSNEDVSPLTHNISNTNQLHDLIMEKKHNLIIKKESFSAIDNKNFYNLSRTQPSSYGSQLFSKLPFEDLKKAHHESIIPISDSILQTNFNSVNELINFRHSDNITPFNDEEQNIILLNKGKIDHEENIRRNFELTKQTEKAVNINKNIKSKFNYLTN